MKKLILLFTTITSLFLLPGCSEKFDVAAPYKNITIIYGFLDMADTAHYIRIQKAFLDQEKSALSMAQEADSNFYASLNVSIARVTFSGVKHDVIPLQRVDLNAEGYPKQSGAFFNSPNYAYKFKDLLDPQYIYRIIVSNPVTGEVDSAEAPIIDDLHSSVFNIDVIDDVDLNRGGLDFESTLSFKNFEFVAAYAPPSNFSFQGQGSPVSIAQSVFRFYWTDSNMLSGAKTNHFGDFFAGNKTIGGNQFNYKILNNELYAGIRNALGPAPANTARLLGRVELFVYLGTPDYSNYEQTSLIKGTGLTGNDIQPVYTNIKGANVLGLFTSRGVRSGLITITGNTIDSLIVSPLLQQANIKGPSYH
jgi:hypothetical protein